MEVLLFGQESTVQLPDYSRGHWVEQREKKLNYDLKVTEENNRQV